MAVGGPSDRIREVTATTLRPGREADFTALVRVWRSSVDATHHFLTAADRDSIEALLASDYLPAVAVTVAEVDGQPVAFAGTSDRRLEMLFVHDALRGRGIGSMLIEHVVHEDGVVHVDVNEQNPAAVDFYISRGFAITGRSDRDDDIRVSRSICDLEPASILSASVSRTPGARACRDPDRTPR